MNALELHGAEVAAEKPNRDVRAEKGIHFNGGGSVTCSAEMLEFQAGFGGES